MHTSTGNIQEALIVRITEMLNFTLSKNSTCMVLFTLPTTMFTVDKTINSIPESSDFPWFDEILKRDFTQSLVYL